MTGPLTAAEWAASADPGRLVQAVRGRVSDRKLRLFACAVARLLPPPANPAEGAERAAAIDAAERFADGQIGPDELARAAACSAGEGFWGAAYPSAPEAAEFAALDDELRGQEAAVAALLRDIVGNPFRPPPFDPAWRTRAVRSVAAAIYDGRAAAWVPVLADALEEAGCHDAALLAHLRGPGPHVRGCWAVDLVLGKGLGEGMRDEG